MVDIGSREQRKIQDVRLSTKYYKGVKLGSGLPTSINKDEKYIKNRSCESSFCKDSKKTVTKITHLLCLKSLAIYSRLDSSAGWKS